MAKKSLFVCCSVFLMLFAAGCKCDSNEIQTFIIHLDSPVMEELVSSLSPTFSWHDNESCEAEDFTISIKENGGSGWGAYEYASGYTSHTWTSALLPGKEYSWHMRPHSTGGSGHNSESSIFYTGPVCSPGTTFVAPELQRPVNNGWISHHKLHEFNWTYPGDCLPESYTYQFATDPGFTVLLTSGTTPLYQQRAYEFFPNCSTVYWRVAAREGSTIGPWSEVFKFHWVRDDSCPQTHHLSDDFAEISGRVYRDMCDQTGHTVSSPFLLHVGCIETVKYGVHANGDYTHLDHGLAQVEVDLGSGPCPSTGLDQDTTYGLNGGFDFVVMTPGEYCLSVSKNQTANDYLWGETLNLMDGFWTELPTGDIVTEYTISLGEGFHQIKRDFGWDEYDMLVKKFEEPTWCRIGPYPICDPLIAFNPGDFTPMMARNEAGTWILTQVNNLPCYFYDQRETSEDSADDDTGMPDDEYDKRKSELEVYPQPPPCPTPTPTPKPKPKPKPEEVDCSRITDSEQCKKTNGCTWFCGAAACTCIGN